MSTRTIGLRIGLVALAIAHVWCASEQAALPQPPAADGGVDAEASVDAGSAGEDAGLSEVPACNDTFCRVAVPDGQTTALDGILVRSPSDVWVVGSGGYAARFDGTTWQRIPTGSKARIFDVAASGDGTVWGASSGDSFFVLSRTVDGGAEVVSGGFSGVVRAIATVGAREAWAVGTGFVNWWEFPPPPAAFIWHYAPGSGGEWGWQPVSPPCPVDEFDRQICMKLNAVWAESAHRVWFVGDEGKVFRSDTSSLADGGGGGDPDAGESQKHLELTEMNSSSLRALNGIWGFGDDDVWAVGVQGVIRHWGGGDAWTIVPSPVTADLNAVWGARPDDVWAVGDDGVVLHWDGKEWTLTPTPYGIENRPPLYAVSGSGADVWIAGQGTLLRSKAPGGDQ
ncbi:MAG: hypothetical protein BGO98_26985 [Myxococcales bacterium 68-20]|nr:hypothetical protein [Myxococcales bacterium]OJY30372.1 MAG: hypothetical protein BGO98_26985 [Myxococcales bacterium 68-20]